VTVGVWVVIDMDYVPRPKVVFASANIDEAKAEAAARNVGSRKRFQVYALSGSITLRKP
jgi:hypothetical protein